MTKIDRGMLLAAYLLLVAVVAGGAWWLEEEAAEARAERCRQAIVETDLLFLQVIALEDYFRDQTPGTDLDLLNRVTAGVESVCAGTGIETPKLEQGEQT